jgi:threonine dehydrogenase-like Zn-dependent dehydrogenase
VTNAESAYAAYRRIGTVPERTLAWNVYGTGVESVGRNGRPEEEPVRSPGPDQLLVRVDAVGLCFSDVKLIRQGSQHPKLYGRDLAKVPTRLGHEAAVTVVAVGPGLHERFSPGQRLAIQPDIYVGGRSTAYGYTTPGALIGYHLIGPEVLAADDGAYVIPIPTDLGYAEAALTEPWACVEAAYSQRRRVDPAIGGRTWVIAQGKGLSGYRFGDVLKGAREVVLSGLGVSLETVARAAAPNAQISVAEAASVTGPFDDIIVLAPRTATLVANAASALAFRGVLNLVGDVPLDTSVEIDLGRIHYHYTAFVGSTGLDVANAYGEARNRTELRSGGVAVFIGAAGPMGQMHLERALRIGDGPWILIGVDLDPARLEAAEKHLAPIAKERGRRLVMSVDPDITAVVRKETDGRGADDVIVTAPTVDAVLTADKVMAPDGMLVLFAGLAVGTRAALDLSRVFLYGAQYTGTSGSRIADQELVVGKTIRGELAPERAVAAVGGIDAAPEGLRALMAGRYAGKIVIFPHLRDLPLTSVDDLAARDPEFASALGEGGTWTSQAEAQLFARYLEPRVLSRA